MEHLDQIKVNFSDGNLLWLNVILALVMFSVAIEIKWADFRAVFAAPKKIVIGLISQFIFLPLLTILLIMVLPLHPSVALGMVMIAVCPGGSSSNFLTVLAKGNVALSVSLTAVSTLIAGFMIPAGFYFWGRVPSLTAPLIKSLNIDFWSMLQLSFWLLLLPLMLGMSLAHFRPQLAKRLSSPLQKISLGVFLVLIIGAFAANFKLFTQLFHVVFWTVLIHNGLALLIGYVFARGMKLPEADARTIAIETGIQNTSIGLALIFNFFPNMGGMAIIVAWWGIWHLISGLGLSYFFRRQQQVGENR